MQQFAEGTRRRSKRTGAVQVYQGGQWVSQGGAPAMPAVIEGPPRLPPPQTETDAARDTVGLERDRIGLEKDRLEVEKLRAGTEAEKVGVEQSKAGGFYGRAIKANEIYQGLGVGAPTLGREVAKTVAPGLVNQFTGAARQQAEAAQEDFVKATLRYESGAAIPPEEISSQVRTYFPVAGDTPETIKLKAQLRQNAIEALKMGAGSAAAQADKSIEGSNRETASVATGETRIENNPALGGVNERIGQMLTQGADDTTILRFLKSEGAEDRALLDVKRQLVEYRKFKAQAEKEGKQVGLPTIDLERQEMPNSTWNQISASPVGAAGMAAANTITGNHLDNIIGAAGGDAELANLGMAQVREQNPLSSLAGDIVGGVGLYGGGRAALGAMGRTAAPATGTFAGRAIAGDAAMGGYIASGSDGTNMLSAPNALLGAAAGAGGGVAGRGAINTAGRALSPSGGALAPAYAEGVRPTIGQRMGGMGNRAEQAFASIPAVGGIQRSARNRAVEDWQAGAFNQALREIGTQLPKGTKSGTAAHAYLQNQFNAAYNRARSGLTFRQDPDFVNDFRAIATEVASLSDQAQRRFASVVKMGENKLRGRGGVLAGDDYKTLVSTIEKRMRAIRKSPNGDYELADVLEDLTLALDQGARRHSAPDAVAALDAADRGYVKAVLIEEAGRKAGGGEIGEFTGKQLESAIRSNSGLRSRRALRGDAPMQDYAAAGVRLGDNMPDSGTPERLMYGGATAGAVGGMAHLIDPIMASPWIANTLMNLPGGKQAVNALISPNRKALDPARRHLLKRAHYGGLLSAPSSQNAVNP